MNEEREQALEEARLVSNSFALFIGLMPSNGLVLQIKSNDPDIP